MKKKLLAIVLTVVMVLAGTVTAFAEAPTTGSITITNASKGETYSVYKIFDATVTGEEGGSIAYTFEGDIPATLAPYFEKDEAGNIHVKDLEGEYTEESRTTALKTYAETLTPVATEEAKGGPLTFDNLPFGYYVVTSTQGESAISVTSTNPDAEIIDKNTTEPGVKKTVDDQDLSIGDTAIYTIEADTANYIGTEQVVQYTISDTLPEFLTNVTVTSIKIGGAEYKVGEPAATPQFVNKEIVIPWVDAEGKSIYANGAKIVITYTAELADDPSLVIDGTTGNVNKVTLQPYKDTPDGPKPFDDKWEDDEKVFTYAAALQKVDENKKPLAGAKFTIAGLQATKVADGEYRCEKYDPSDATIVPTELVCDAEGQLVILGLESGNTLVATETEAPAGYNKLVDTVDLTSVKTGEEITKTSTTVYYDANGKVTSEETTTSYEKTTYNVNLLKTAIVVVNQKGSAMPSTGGMGTTILYTLGGLLVVGAGVLLVARRKMDN